MDVKYVKVLNLKNVLRVVSRVLSMGSNVLTHIAKNYSPKMRRKIINFLTRAKK